MAAFTVCVHAGQGCAITTRLVVPRAQFDDAVEVTAAALAKLPAGDPTDPGTICGPLINARQRDRVERYIAHGPRRRRGRSWSAGAVPPTRPGGSSSNRRSSSGSATIPPWHEKRSSVPSSSSSPTTGTTTPLRIANDSPYGLSGSVWSGDRDRAMAVARRLRTGTVGVNGGVWYSPDVPFGGYKQSGLGREMGVAGFEEYLETKVVAEPA